MSVAQLGARDRREHTQNKVRVLSQLHGAKGRVLGDRGEWTVWTLWCAAQNCRELQQMGRLAAAAPPCPLAPASPLPWRQGSPRNGPWPLAGRP